METLLDLLETTAERSPSDPALMINPNFRYRVWSYEDVWRDSSRVANYLQRQGIKKGDRVLIHGPNMPQWAIALFGIVRAGAVAVPLDVRSAPDFVERVVDQTEPTFVFTSRFVPQPLNVQVPTVNLEELDTVIVGVEPTPEPVEIRPDDLAEIMFTSGTTGDPKGVMLTHRNVVSNAQATAARSPGSASDRVISLLPLSHMFEQNAGLFAPFLFGARVVYPTSRQPASIFRALRENRITFFGLVPQGLQLFMDGIEREVERKGRTRMFGILRKVARKLPMAGRRVLFRSVLKQMGGKIRFIGSGGSYLDPALAGKWEDMGIPITEGYGTTETAPVITFNRLENRIRGSVGVTLDGQEVRIAEDGEVLTRGPNVTPGYWQKEEATAAVFDGDWYKTGDLGHLDESGNLYLRGRKKDLIVLANGQNVYPEDIERLLNLEPTVKDSTVVGLPDRRDGGETVHAVLLLEEDTDPDVAMIIEEVNSRLADHQRVTGHTVWGDDDLPRTHTLKVKKPVVIGHLQAAAEAAEGEKATVVSAGASTALVDPLMRVIAQVSDKPVDTIGPEMTIGGDLGLEPLRRVELLSIIEQELGVYVDESSVEPTTTVSELRERVEKPSEGPADPTVRFLRWPLSAWCGAVREAVHHAIVSPWMASKYRARASGLENIEGIDGPVQFAINHNAVESDAPMVRKVLPGRWRRRMSYAAAAEIHFDRWWMGTLLSIVVNAFPLSRDTAIRPSLEHLGRLLDDGWSVGIYPEGEQRVGEEMLPFQSGTGLLAVESRTPVVPVGIVSHGATGGGPFGLLKREGATVHFGEPITFAPGTSYIDATQRIEDAVKALVA